MKYLTPILMIVFLTVACSSKRTRVRQEFISQFKKDTEETTETKPPAPQIPQEKPAPTSIPPPPDEFIIPDILTADIPAEIQKGRKYFEEKNYSASLEQYELFTLKAPPDTPYFDEALLMTGVNYDWIAKNAKDVYFIKKERQALTKLVNEYPQSIHKAEGHFYLGQTYGGFTGVTLPPDEINYPLAINHLENAYKQSHQKWIKSKSFLRLGQIYQKKGLTAKAKEYYLAVRDIYPKSQSALEALGILKAMSAEPPDEIDLTEVGRKLFDGGEYELAFDVFRKAQEKYSDTSKASYCLMMQGICCLWRGDLERAENILRKSYSTYAESRGETAFYLAYILEKRGKVAEAVKLYKEAFENPLNYDWVIKSSKERLTILEKSG